VEPAIEAVPGRRAEAAPILVTTAAIPSSPEYALRIGVVYRVETNGEYQDFGT
jgi:hypothetical protein